MNSQSEKSFCKWLQQQPKYIAELRQIIQLYGVDPKNAARQCDDVIYRWRCYWEDSDSGRFQITYDERMHLAKRLLTYVQDAQPKPPIQLPLSLKLSSWSSANCTCRACQTHRGRYHHYDYDDYDNGY